MVHTHYDNLKVAHDAPIEVIKAAYRALAQRYHPDVNPSPDAARIMKVLNEAWEVLGDSNRRAQHDQWIAEQESKRCESIKRNETEQPRAHAQTYDPGHNWKWESEPPPWTDQRQGTTKPKPKENARKANSAAKENVARTTNTSNSTFPKVGLKIIAAAYAVIIILPLAAGQISPPRQNAESPQRTATEFPPVQAPESVVSSFSLPTSPTGDAPLGVQAPEVKRWSEPIRRTKAESFNYITQSFNPIIARNIRPNFAEKYVVVVDPCGTGCRVYSVGNVSTGRVIDFPLGGEEYGHLNLYFRLDSTSIIAVWDEYGGGICFQERFKLENGALVSLGRSGSLRQQDSDCEVPTNS